MTKCQVLDNDGNRCKRKASKYIKYIGDTEIYGCSYDTELVMLWVKIKVCELHGQGH